VIATSGIGGLFLHAPIQPRSFGQALRAARASADMADLGSVQFHPTALDGKSCQTDQPGGAGQGAIFDGTHRFTANGRRELRAVMSSPAPYGGRRRLGVSRHAKYRIDIAQRR
jgi:aspartate oxidase